MTNLKTRGFYHKIYTLFPIILFRNPFMTIQSMFSVEKQNNFSTRMFEGDNSSDVVNCVDIYIKYYDFIIKQLNNENYFICNLENLINNPKKEIKSLFNFLEIDINEKKLNYIKNFIKNTPQKNNIRKSGKKETTAVNEIIINSDQFSIKKKFNEKELNLIQKKLEENDFFNKYDIEDFKLKYLQRNY